MKVCYKKQKKKMNAPSEGMGCYWEVIDYMEVWSIQ